MLNAAVAAARIGAELDATLSVDALGIYKPRPEVYALVTERFQLGPADMVFVSSNRWDVTGAPPSAFTPPGSIARTARKNTDLPPARSLPDFNGLTMFL